VDLGNRLVRQALIFGHRQPLIRVYDIQQVVRNSSAFRRRGLRGADVHAAVDLARIGRDDLAAWVAASPMAIRSCLPP